MSHDGGRLDRRVSIRCLSRRGVRLLLR
jgi:hypothetical protein